MVFLGSFWAYAGQPHNHVGWAMSMPFASINSTNPRTNPWNFHKKILRISGAGKWLFFRRPLWFFFLLYLIKKAKGFHMKHHFFCTMDGLFRILEKTSSEHAHDCSSSISVFIVLGLYNFDLFILFLPLHSNALYWFWQHTRWTILLTILSRLVQWN